MYEEIIQLLQAESTDIRLSPTEFAQIMERNKPHLIRLEEEVARVDYGTVNIELNVRAGKVVGMEFIEVRKKWLPPKSD